MKFTSGTASEEEGASAKHSLNVTQIDLKSLSSLEHQVINDSEFT